jgi:two-component system NtrC family sensor kinase
MKLNKKILIILFGFIVLFVAGTYLIQRLILFPSFLSLENKEAIKDINRVIQSLNRETSYLNALAHDWSAWDDTYEFIETGSMAYIDANLTFSTFTNNSLNLIYFLNLKHETVWGQIYDLESEKTVSIKEFEPTFLSKNDLLLSYNQNKKQLSDTSISGVMLTEKGPLLVSSRPILDSHNQGPARGYLLMGKLLNESIIKKLNEQTKVRFKISAAQKEAVPVNDREPRQILLTGSKYYVDEVNDDLLRVYTAVMGISGTMALLISAEIEREISREGRQSLQYGLLIGVIASLIAFLVVLLAMQKVVVDPLRKLTHYVQSIKNSEAPAILPSIDRQDELGILQTEFNNTLVQLDQTRKKLLEQSYYSGMADMMSGILHNIRNSLSPIKGYAAMLRSDMAKAPLKNIQQVKDELLTDNLSVDRKNDLIQYLLLLVDNFSDITAKAEEKLAKISTSVSKIEIVLKNNQKWAHADRPLEFVRIESFLNDVIDQQRKSIPGDIKTALIVEDSAQDSIRIHVSLLKQVFSKILLNASESIEQSRTRLGTIRIRVTGENIAGRNMIHYEFCDNGEGIPADSLKMIFERGFTTKNRGISTIGLHWCANTVNSMKGKIYAESDGLGKGACFHVLLPLNADSIG